MFHAQIHTLTAEKQNSLNDTTVKHPFLIAKAIVGEISDAIVGGKFKLPWQTLRKYLHIQALMCVALMSSLNHAETPWQVTKLLVT